MLTGQSGLGKMNMATKRVRDNTNGIFPQKKVDDLLASQTDEKIITLYNKHKYDDRIKWKESIIKVVSQHHLI